MRTLYLMRHAKSSWIDGGLSDHDRPLAPRGRAAAAAMAAHMRTAGMIPDHVLCSSAARTRETWSLAGPLLAPDAPVELSKELYLADAATLLDATRGLDDRLGRVLLLGHNPGMQDFAAALSGTGDDRYRARLRSKFPTGAIAEIRFLSEAWLDIAFGLGRLETFLRPADLPGGGEDR